MMKEGKAAIKAIGLDSTRYALLSAKRGGVLAGAEAGLDLARLTLAGQWKSPKISLRYITGGGAAEHQHRQVSYLSRSFYVAFWKYIYLFIYFPSRTYSFVFFLVAHCVPLPGYFHFYHSFVLFGAFSFGSPVSIDWL
jgi:hypothetical protein